MTFLSSPVLFFMSGLPKIGLPLFFYLLIINLAAFALFGLDKQRARTGGWRLPEMLFFGLAILGAVSGLWFGMAAFRHKTRKLRFRIGLPVIGALQLAFLIWLMSR